MLKSINVWFDQCNDLTNIQYMYTEDI